MRTIVVTGASTGIGRAVALALAARGDLVLAGVRTLADAPEHERIQALGLDVTSAADVDALRERLAETRLDGLVNNAGVVTSGPLEALTAEDWRSSLEVNVVGLAAVTAACLPALRAARGRIVNVGSMGAVVAPPFVGPYVASKGAVRSLSDSLRRELLPLGVRVSLIEPGAIDTPIWAKGDAAASDLVGALPPALREVYGRNLAGFQRLSRKTADGAASPEEAAAIVVRALTARRPPARAFVGRDAKLNGFAARVLPAGVIDRVAVRLARG